MKKITWLLTVLLTTILLTSCNQPASSDEAKNIDREETNRLISEKDTQISELQKEKEDLQNSLENIELDLKYTKEEADYYKQLLNDIIIDFRDEQENELSRDLWEYELNVNGIVVSDNGVVNTKNNIIEISIVQMQPPYQILPNNVFLNGKISGDYYDHISDFSQTL